MASLESNIHLEAAEQRGLFEFIQTLPSKSPTTFRLFDRGEYYTCHEEDAFFAAKEVFKSAGVIKKLGPKNVPSVALSPKNFQFLLRELLVVKQYRVEVYGSRVSKSKEAWELQYTGSPGNLTQFEDVLYSDHGMDEASGSGAVAIKVTSEEGHRIVGVAFCDSSSRTLKVSQFSDSEMFINLETVLVQLSPKEAVVQSGSDCKELSNFNQLLQRLGLLVTEKKKSDFTTKDLPQDLARLLKKGKLKEFNVTTLDEWELTNAMCSLAALLKYLEVLSSETNFNAYVMNNFELKNFMRIGASAVKALNLLPSSGESNTKNTNLFGLLNKCCTAPGQRLLGQWIKQPLMDVNKINERLNIVEAFMDGVLRQTVQEDHLKRFPDIQRLSKKLQRGKGTLMDVYAVYLAAKQLPALIGVLSETPDDFIVIFNEVFVSPFKQVEGSFKLYLEMVESTIDCSKPHELCIKASFAESLQEIRDKIDELELTIMKQLDRVARELDLDAGKSVKLESTPQLGYFFRVTQKDEQKLRKNKNFTPIETNKSGVKFHNSRLSELNEQYLHQKKRYSEEEEDIKSHVLQLAVGYTPAMQLLNDLVAKLDVFISFATASANAPTPYVKPKILPRGNGKLHLPKARHPCLEVQDDISFIANDASFDKDESSFHIITGPNMGGKSTYIRSVGILCIMAQMGCFVPCSPEDDPIISVIDAVLTRVGAGDSQLKGVSTFMAEMLESASILSSATKDSLIIIDELGRGTSTYDGFGIAWGISEQIVTQIGAFTLFATHFHELTELAEEFKGVQNFHVTALVKSEQEDGEDAFTLLYSVQPGVCDQSFGIHVARLAHFPNHVIEDAKRKAAELEDFQGICSIGTKEDVDMKRQKLECKDGEKLIDEFLKEWNQLPESVSHDVKQEKLEEIRDRIQMSGNSFLQSLL